MFRPISFKENECKLTLMKNRREELLLVDTKLIDSIVFNVTEPAKMTITIPSHITHRDSSIAYPLFEMVQGKMQLILEINGIKYRFIIEDINEKNGASFSTKTLTCYEWQYNLQKLNFYIGDVAITRQLYRGSDDLEVSDGILDWFEQYCTGWKVAHVDQKAKQELTMCATSEKIELYTDLVIDQVKINTKEDSGNWLINKDVSIDIGEKPLNMSISWDCEVYDSQDKLYLSTTSTHDFINLPYAIKNIKAEYVSNAHYMYGIQYTITYINNTTDTMVYNFLNCKGLKLKVKTVNIIYELGDWVENWVTKYRTFETQSCSWLSMLTQVEEAFDCVITFDSYNQTISVYDKGSFGEEVGLMLTFENALKEISKQKKIGDVVSRLYVESSNTSIASVNPLGTEYVESFEYYKNHGIMSEELKKAIEDYDDLIAEKDIEFMTLNSQKREKDQRMTLESSRLTSVEEQHTAENAILISYIKYYNDAPESEKNAWAEKQAQQQERVVALEKEIETIEDTIQELENEIEVLQNAMTQIGIDIAKENATYNGKKLFTDELLLELSDYIVESSISDEVYLTSSGLYSHAVQTLSDMQSVYIDFTISADVEFLNKLQTPNGFSNFIFLGAKIMIEDTSGELADDDGLVVLYSYTYSPKTNKISNFKFTNNKEAPTSSIRTIGSIAKQTNATKSLTDFYKATWEDTRQKTVDIGKIITEGLDLSAQKIRSRTEKNVIEMDEAGIFLIDASDTNNQLGMINDLICMTDDKWKTSKIAISPEGIVADLLIGRVILGQELYISNGDFAFQVRDNGMTIKDRVGSDKIFIGLDDNYNPVFKLGMNKEQDHLMWENGELSVRAKKVTIGSEDAITHSSLKIETDKIYLEVENTEKRLQTEIQQTADAIRLEVSDKIGVNELSTLIEQNATSITLAINNAQGSNGIKIETSGMGVYNNNTKTMELNNGIMKVYNSYTGAYMGYYGTIGNDLRINLNQANTFSIFANDLRIMEISYDREQRYGNAMVDICGGVVFSQRPNQDVGFNAIILGNDDRSDKYGFHNLSVACHNSLGFQDNNGLTHMFFRVRTGDIITKGTVYQNAQTPPSTYQLSTIATSDYFSGYTNEDMVNSILKLDTTVQINSDEEMTMRILPNDDDLTMKIIGGMSHLDQSSIMAGLVETVKQLNTRIEILENNNKGE